MFSKKEKAFPLGKASGVTGKASFPVYAWPEPRETIHKSAVIGQYKIRSIEIKETASTGYDNNVRSRA
jgi:hypothetical protein